MVPFRTILCPTDFSPSAHEALDLACSLAASSRARVILLHVNDVLYGKQGYGGMMVEIRPADYPAQLYRTLKGLTPTRPDVPVEHLLTEGRPVPEILRVARERQCDLIVMGTRGATGLHHLLLGSVAEQVLRQAPCPVVTVRAAPQQ